MELSRNQEQEKIMQVVYGYLFYQVNNKEEDVKTLMEGVYEDEYENIPTFSKEVIVKSLLNQPEIDKLIAENLSEKLRLDRLNIVGHAILLFSIGEVKYCSFEDVSKATMINVAVELAKKYLDDKEYRFINAVLDKIL
jgi:transcription antitermination protein NusB